VTKSAPAALQGRLDEGVNEARVTVTIVAHRLAVPGGMEQVLQRLVTGLLEDGNEVTVIARRCGLSARPGLRRVKVPGPERPFAFAYPWFFIVGSFMVWRNRNGLLHTTGAIVLNRADVSSVHLCHHALQAKTDLRRRRRTGVLYRLNAWAAAHLSRMAERWCYRPGRTRHLIAVSEGVAAELRWHFPAMATSVSVIANGVDRGVFRPDKGKRARIRSELGLRADDLVALFVSAEWEAKGLRFVLDAIGRTPDWHLVVVGDGDVVRYRRIAGRIAGERVHFLGGKEDPSPYYAAADAFVLPSIHESFSLVTLEAAASALPLLVTRVSGVEDILIDGENGWFIERDGALIADRLGRLRVDRALCRAMGAAGRATSNRFGWERAVNAHIRLYRELSQDGNGR
jgi:glycosyltransferase involved in cell wall biosynthesis